MRKLVFSSFIFSLSERFLTNVQSLSQIVWRSFSNDHLNCYNSQRNRREMKELGFKFKFSQREAFTFTNESGIHFSQKIISFCHVAKILSVI